MDLKLFFDPIHKDIATKDFTADSFVQSVYFNEEKMPEIKGMDIALIGIVDKPNAPQPSNSSVQHIRRKLYDLKESSGSCKVIDLGNLRSGPNNDETIGRVQAVCHYLMQKQVLPILIGGSQDYDIGQFKSYEDEEKFISVCCVDSRIDMDAQTEHGPDRHIHDMLIHEPNYLFGYSHIGYQSYFVSSENLKTLRKLNFTTMRLGEMREDFKKVEPIIREADMLSFDISAIQKMYTPAGSRSDVFGLTGEEACQIMWYAGLNDKLSSLGIYEYHCEKDSNDHQTAQVIATMIWYFVEGFKNRKSEKGFQTNDYLKYQVTMDAEPASITFYKSRLSDKWWMEVPKVNSKSVYDRNIIVPCDHYDYEQALKGEIPDRWISTFAKFS